MLEDDERAVLVGREGHLDLGRLVVGVTPGMPSEADPAGQLVVEHLAPLGFATVHRLLDEAPAVAVLEDHGLCVVEEDPLLL